MGPLSGVRVLDLTRLLPGGFCSMILSDLGADVIKVEQAPKGDYTREMFPGMYYAVNRNKKSIAINLKLEAGKEIIYKLAEKSDIVLESFRPGVAERLQVDYSVLQRIRSDIIYVSISAYGQFGPYRSRPGHDLNCLAAAGAMSVPGRLDHQPERSSVPVADLAAAMFGVIAAIVSLIWRDKTGKGQYIDVSMADCALSWMAPRFGDYMLTGKEASEGTWSHISAVNDVFVTADEGKIALAALEPHFWEGLCKAIGREDLLQDPRLQSHQDRQKTENARFIAKVLREEIRKKTRNEWLRIMDRYGIPAAPVLSVSEVFSDPHFHERQMFQEVFVPCLDRNIKQLAFPVIMSGGDVEVKNVKSAPPSLGQHTDEILYDLGYDAETVRVLREQEVVI